MAAILATSKLPPIRCGDHQRAAERLLHRHLLVEHHADEQRVVVVGEQWPSASGSPVSQRGLVMPVILPQPRLDCTWSIAEPYSYMTYSGRGFRREHLPGGHQPAAVVADPR